VFFAWLLRFILIYWLISVLYRWLTGGGQTGKRQTGGKSETERPQTTVSGVPYESNIEDADFEDIDDRDT